MINHHLVLTINRGQNYYNQIASYFYSCALIAPNVHVGKLLSLLYRFGFAHKGTQQLLFKGEKYSNQLDIGFNGITFESSWDCCVSNTYINVLDLFNEEI